MTRKLKLIMRKDKIINACDKIVLFSIYAVAFFLPISKGIIETFSYMAIFFFLLGKILSRDDFRKSPINYAILAYLVICFVSVFYSSNPKISIRTFLGKDLQNTTFFLVVANALTNKRRLRTLAFIMFISAFVVGIDGVSQYFTHKDFIRHRPSLEFSRIYASFGTPNDFGCYLISILPFVLSLLFMKSCTKKTRIFLGILFILLFSCLVLTVSRGAWLAFLAIALLLNVWMPSLRFLFLFLGLFIVSSFMFLPPLVRVRLTNFFSFLDQSSLDRKMLWEAGWKMFISHPWLGLGLGTFMFNFENFVVKNYPNSISYAHNCYLQMASEIGIIGLIVFLSILGLFFYHTIKMLKLNGKSISWHILLGSMAAVMGYSVQIGVDTFLYSLDLGMLFWLLLGIGMAAAEVLNEGKEGVGK